jgi:hypothetical protein
MASVTAEVVITEMQLNASNYVAGANQVIAANQRLQASAMSLQAAMGGAGGGGFGNNNVFNFGGGGGGSGGGIFGGRGIIGAYMFLRVIREVEHAIEDLAKKFVDLSVEAFKQFASFDTLSRSFEGIYGSGMKAGQMMTYLRDIAMTSAFHFRDLADAARSISVAGLDVNRFLPITQGFALAMGKIDSGGLQDFIGILRRIMGGNTGVALGPRGIGRYGVSHQELENYGATFDAQGHFTGTINQALDAIENVFTHRFKAIADKVTGSTEVALSNWADAVQQAMIDFGAGMKDQVIDPLTQATSAFNTLRQGGVFKSLGSTLWSTILGGVDLSGAEPFKFTANDKETQAQAAARYRKEFTAYTNQRTGYTSEGGYLHATTTGDPIQDTLIHIGGGIVSLVEYAREYVKGAKATYDVLSGIYNLTRYIAAIPTLGLSLLLPAAGKWAVSGAVQAGQDWEDQQFGNLRGQALSRGLHPERYGAPQAPPGTGIGGVDPDEEPEDPKERKKEYSEWKKYMRETAENTRRMARQMDLSAHAFGGGDLGRIGVTPVELSTYRHGSGTTGGIEGVMSDTGKRIGYIVQGMIWDAISHGMRQGMFLGSR